MLHCNEKTERSDFKQEPETVLSKEEHRKLLEKDLSCSEHVKVRIVNSQIVYFDALTGKALACHY